MTSYREKPTHHFRVSSAVYALGGRALDALQPGERWDAPDLARALIDGGARVHALEHAAPWIDVNDSGGLRAAERLLAAHADAFDCWHPAPTVEVVGCVLVRGNDEVLLEYRPATARCYAAQWDTPGGHIDAGETPRQAIVRELDEELGLRHRCRQRRASTTSMPRRARSIATTYSARASTTRFAARDGQRLAWHPRGQIVALPDIGTAALRSLAALEAGREPPARRHAVHRAWHRRRRKSGPLFRAAGRSATFRPRRRHPGPSRRQYRASPRPHRQPLSRRRCTLPDARRAAARRFPPAATTAFGPARRQPHAAHCDPAGPPLPPRAD